MQDYTQYGRIRVVTWNVLSDDYQQSERLKNIAAHLGSIKPDIILLQEVWEGAAQALADQTNYHMAGQTSGTYSNAILTRTTPTEESQVTVLPGTTALGEPIQAIHATVTSKTGRTWHAISTHLSWGGNTEHYRLAQAVAIDQLVQQRDQQNSDAVTVLGGDFNCTPESSTLGYLTGKLPHNNTSTYWVDAWEKAGQGDGTTSDPDNVLARRIAGMVGISEPALLPKRRIDYLLVAGYAHGRPGCPLACHVDQPPGTSDHGAVVAELWDPPIAEQQN